MAPRVVDCMERIKAALEKARANREKLVDNSQGTGDSNDPAGLISAAGGLFAREPFNRFTAREREQILESGRIATIEPDDTVVFGGDRDSHIHFLLSGTVAIHDGAEPTIVAAEDAAATAALDVAGIKEHTITAQTEVEVLRIHYGAMPVASIDGPVPQAVYTETYSGQQLADLVDEIERDNLAIEKTQDISRFAGEEQLDIQSDLDELSESASGLLADIESIHIESDDETHPAAVADRDDDLSRFLHEMENRFRHYVDAVRAQERERFDARLTSHAEKLKRVAEQQLRKNAVSLRDRYQDAYATQHRLLRRRYRRLKTVANTLAHQKAAIYAARRQISEKLQLVEQVHQELDQLGHSLDRQLDDLDGSIPGDALDEVTPST